MPAANMAGPVTVPANPSGGKAVLMSPFSGPKGSPLDAVQINPTTFARTKDPNNFSVGALNTGIGYGLNTGPIINVSPGTDPFTAPGAIKRAGFTDDYTPGVTLPGGSAATTAILTAIGGGKSTAAVNGIAPTVPYVAQPLLAFGAGSSRDAGAGPAFTGFGVKMVTAAGAVADGAAIEAGFVNRTGLAMVATQSAFGSSTTASPAVT